MMKYTFKPGLIPTLAFLVILPCLIALGFWQVDRADQKRAILAGMDHARTEAPLNLIQAMTDLKTQAYYGIQLEGRFMPNEDMLLMHANEHNQVGYYVLSSFETEYQGSQVYILVNRGFIEGKSPAPLRGSAPFEKGATKHSSARNEKGATQHNPSQTQVIRGIITRPQPTRFILGETVPDPKAKPLMVQRTDLEAISQVTGRTYLPLVVLAEGDLSDGLLRDWQLNVMPPEKHLGYALQWFALALCLVIIYIVVNLRRRP